MRRMLAVTALVLVLAGCASANDPARPPTRTTRSAPSPTQSASLRCPVNEPHETSTAPLRTHPVGGLACLVREPPEKRLAGKPLDRRIAILLARIIATAPTMRGSIGSRCALGADHVVALVRFRYANASVSDVSDVAPNCHGVAYVGARPVRLPSFVGEYLFALANPFFRAVRVPLAVREYLDVRDSPPCTHDQLAAQYLPGGVGTGNDFGTIVLRNVSTHWCAFSGPVRVTGLDADGQVTTDVVGVSVARYVDLSPRAVPQRLHHDPPDGERLAGITLIAGYRDDPSAPDGSCYPHWVVPKAWRIEVGGGTFTVPNADGVAGRYVGSQGLVTCRGRFGAGRVSVE